MFWDKKKQVFLDYASTTPVAPEVLSVMSEYDKRAFANPSALYTDAINAKDVVLKSRETIADILNCQKNEIIFTSGGTEGNNLALLGVFESVRKPDFIPHIIAINIEHPAVLEVCNEIRRRGGEVTVLSVDHEGLVSARSLREALKPNTVLVSIMYANNEIGTIQPIKELTRVVKDYRKVNKTEFPYFHTDACQASLHLSLDVLKLGVDLMTLDGIKVYGPRGFGVLFRRGNVSMSPVMFGGGQEGGLRSGTENVSAILGFAKALEIAERMKENESKRLTEIRDHGIEKILKTFPKATLNGSKENRLPNNINVCFEGLDAEFAVIALDVHGVSCSYSSSCRTLKEDSSSYVVEALGKSNCKESSLRFTLGRETNQKDIDFLVTLLKSLIK